MGSTYRDVHAGFSKFEASETVDHGDAMNGKLVVEMRGDLLNFGQGHGLVRFVFEVEGAAILGMVADKSVEDNNGAVCVAANISGESDWVDGLVNQRCDIGGGSGHRYTSATADRWEEGNFIAGVKKGVPRSELLVARGD